MQNDAAWNEHIKKLDELTNDISFAMLTTVEPHGSLQSRPMATHQMAFNGDLWVFTGASSHKVYNVENNPQVNVTFSDPDGQKYVAMPGRASLVLDTQKAKDLWNGLYRWWFPHGLDNPDLVVLKIEVDGAKEWDSPSRAVIHAYGLAKIVLTRHHATIRTAPKRNDHR